MNKDADTQWEAVFEHVVREKRLALIKQVRNHIYDLGKRSGSGSSALVQSALAQAAADPRTAEIENAEEMFSWISKFVHNRCRNVVRQFASRRTLALAPEEIASIQQKQLESAELEQDMFLSLRPCIDQLASEQQMIVSLWMLGWTLERIGQELDPPRSESQVQWAWRRVRSDLRDCAVARGLIEET